MSAQSKRDKRTVEKSEAEIGDAMIFVCIYGLEMLVAAVEILNRLRRAEQIVTGEDVYGDAAFGRIEIPMLADVQAALLSHEEIARDVPIEVIRKQRLLWEAEVARFATTLHSSTFRARIEERERRRTAQRMLADGDAKQVRRKATLNAIADALKIRGTGRHDRIMRGFSSCARQ